MEQVYYTKTLTGPQSYSYDSIFVSKRYTLCKMIHFLYHFAQEKFSFYHGQTRACLLSVSSN